MKRTQKICRQDKGKGTSANADVKKAQRRAERREAHRLMKADPESVPRMERRNYYGWSL